MCIRLIKYTVVFILSAVCPGYGQQGSATADASAVVCWQPDRKLRWEDFQATIKPTLRYRKIKPGHFLGAVTEANATVYDLSTEAGQYVKTVVRVEFDKRQSWVNTTNYFDKDAALIHEQLHFDIVELTGRKIRRVLARCAAHHTTYHTPVIEAEIGCIYDEETEMQFLYDQEAGDGDEPVAQLRWQVRINNQLQALREYQSTPADCATP